MNFKYVYTPQESIYDVYNYQFNQTCLKVSHKLKMSETEEVTSDSYYDIRSLELDKVYNTEHPLINIEAVDGECIFNLLYAVPTEEEYHAFEPEILDVEFEEFEIPEDAEIIHLEELVFPEPEPDPIDQVVAENKALEVRLESMKRQLEEDRRVNEETTLELLELMMGLI